MIEALKGEEIVDRAGGRFRLCSLIQHRLREILDGARPLVERDGRSDLELVVEEIMQGKIEVAEAQGAPEVAATPALEEAPL